MLLAKEVTESQMSSIGQAVAHACQAGSVIYLLGTLGMGKTTLSREVVQALGWSGKVKSPTYTLVEAYEASQASILHFDLYRLSDPEELEFMGIRDFDPQTQLWLVEWPEKGDGILPPADIYITLASSEQGDRRVVSFSAETQRGEDQLKAIEIYMESDS